MCVVILTEHAPSAGSVGDQVLLPTPRFPKPTEALPRMNTARNIRQAAGTRAVIEILRRLAQLTCCWVTRLLLLA